jgi:hypothetical protein
MDSSDSEKKMTILMDIFEKVHVILHKYVDNYLSVYINFCRCNTVLICHSDFG